MLNISKLYVCIEKREFDIFERQNITFKNSEM